MTLPDDVLIAAVSHLPGLMWIAGHRQQMEEALTRCVAARPDHMTEQEATEHAYRFAARFPRPAEESLQVLEREWLARVGALKTVAPGLSRMLADMAARRSALVPSDRTAGAAEPPRVGSPLLRRLAMLVLP